MLSYATDEIPARFRDRTLEGYEPGTSSQRRALAEARRMVAGEIRSLVLVGPPGVGKSHLAAAVYRELEPPIVKDHRAAEERYMERYTEAHQRTSFRARGGLRYVAPRWQNLAELVSGLRLDMDRPLDDRTWAHRLQSDLRPAPFLVLDDLGREKVSDWTGELVYALVNARYENQLRTIATSNLSASELEANGYWAVISRLAEDGALVEISAPDRRLAR